MSKESNYVVCFGEVLWDVYPTYKKLGGAPFNVAAHLQQLGSHSQIISRVGIDDNGTAIIDAIRARGISVDFVQLDPSINTGIVQVVLDELGIPSYDIKQNVSWEQITADPKDEQLVNDSKALVFGTLACRSETSRASLLKLLTLSNLNICDLNIRQSFYSASLIATLLNQTHILKVNDEEEDLIAELFDLGKEDVPAKIAQKFDLEMIIKTLGKDGAQVFKDGKIITVNGTPIDVVDTVGSGDAFLAAFIHNYLNENSLENCLSEACKLGAFVATKKGAIPNY